MNEKSPSLQLVEISPLDSPLELLLLADPSKDNIMSYLGRSRCFAACSDHAIVGICIVSQVSDKTHEIMNIAVKPSRQNKGIGTALLRHVISIYRHEGAHRLDVGTGTFGYQLAFYQRQGFRVSRIDTDFFLKNYPEPLFENGIQLKDMLRLTLALQHDQTLR
ncbi:GNAT family N-acetyltransferase [Desulfolutivibrio sulfoxidireducens]|uniref:GNAT family N-acetyltransferase n=2 Tax=Desulfolutivibrio sulfoxidireducens TaxID=2773299 RepID=UPI00159DAEFA|nr:GNAT family N-acetyltransferase [Desulfolutivibrio sulfoxidireducens]QLA19818.1 GNAT family N-acetyltransferase [Desulfolutivibrio sulfoxidireducens]